MSTIQRSPSTLPSKRQGAEIYFQGRRCEHPRQGPHRDHEISVFLHQLGSMMIHTGAHRHGVLPIVSGHEKKHYFMAEFQPIPQGLRRAVVNRGVIILYRERAMSIQYSVSKWSSLVWIQSQASFKCLNFGSQLCCVLTNRDKSVNEKCHQLDILFFLPRPSRSIGYR